MPDREHHTPQQYGCPTAVYAVLVTAGPVGHLMCAEYHTDPDEAVQRAGYLAGVVVLLPIIHCNLPSREEWTV